jgi:hypothetical protein
MFSLVSTAVSGNVHGSMADHEVSIRRGFNKWMHTCEVPEEPDDESSSSESIEATEIETDSQPRVAYEGQFRPVDIQDAPLLYELDLCKSFGLQLRLAPHFVIDVD